MIKKILISPPFGHYLNFSWATSVDGTFTLERRNGLIKQCIKTIRPIPGGWINKIGFRNPGIKNVKKFKKYKIYSVSGMDRLTDWRIIMDYIPPHNMVELNVGCPNIQESSMSYDILLEYKSRFSFVSMKIPPTEKARYYIDLANMAGIDAIHLCNTIPTKNGGESGKRLKLESLKWISYSLTQNSKMPIIGGGGIYEPQDVIDYHNAGASYFSLGTIWFNPWKIPAVIRAINNIK